MHGKHIQTTRRRLNVRVGGPTLMCLATSQRTDDNTFRQDKV